MTVTTSKEDPPNPTTETRNYVSWPTTFHPDRGNECLTATAIRAQQLAESKWCAAWAEATLMENEEDEGNQVGYNDDGGDGDGGGASSKPLMMSHGSNSGESNKGGPVTTHNHESNIPPWRNSNLLELILGISLTVAAVAQTFGIEVGAAVVFALAAAFYNTADFCRRQKSVLLCLWWVVFGIVYMALQVTDSILLTVSVLMAEILAALGFLVTAVSGNQGSEWHQYIRKLCHLTRWVFRDFQSAWDKPKRLYYPPFRQSLVSNDERDDIVHVVVEDVTFM